MREDEEQGYLNDLAGLCITFGKEYHLLKKDSVLRRRVFGACTTKEVEEDL